MRKIQVKNGEPWEFTIGKGNAVIKNPRTGKKIIVPFTLLTGRDWSTIERGQWKKTSDGMVKPGHVRAYIEKHLLEPPNMTKESKKKIKHYSNPSTPFAVAKRVTILLAKIGAYTSNVNRGTNPTLVAYDIKWGREPGPQFAVFLPTWRDKKTERRWKKFQETHGHITEKDIRKANLPLEFLGSVRVLPTLEVVAEGEGHGVIDRTAQIQNLLDEARHA